MRAASILLVFLILLLPSARADLPTPLQYGVAVEAGNVPAVKNWLEEGLPVDFVADRIGTGLMIAAWNGHLALIDLYLAHGAQVNLSNDFDEQALHFAAWQGHLEAVERLLEHGAAIDRPGQHWSPLHYAVFAGHEKIARLLMARGANLDARTPNDSTPLMMAAREGHADLAEALVKAGADTRPVNEHGDNALAFAMRNKNYRIAKLVSAPEEFAAAARKPEAYGPARKSVMLPQEAREIIEKMRLVQAAGGETDELREALYELLKIHHKDEIQRAEQRNLKQGPQVLVITADPQKSGRERAELIRDPARRDAQKSAPGKR